MNNIANRSTNIFSVHLHSLILLTRPCKSLGATPLPQLRGHVSSSGMTAAFKRESNTVSSFPPRSRRKVLLSQSRAMTLKGPMYLGARLGCPNRSSLENTWLAVQSIPATKGEALKHRRSSDAGEKPAPFACADSNCSAAVLRCDWHDWKHAPCTLSEITYITSTVGVAVSSFGALRTPRGTHSNDLVHDRLLRTAQRSRGLGLDS